MPDHYACFSCRTHFVIPPKVEQPVNGVRKIHLDKNGHMILPPERPDFLVLKTATAQARLVSDEKSAGHLPVHFTGRTACCPPENLLGFG
jgi:hypothetical protein